jgi:hypothetical protein
MFADENIGVTDQNGNAVFRFWAQIRHFFGWEFIGFVNEIMRRERKNSVSDATGPVRRLGL